MNRKNKTETAISKRFSVTKNGKMLRRKQNARHLRAAKSKPQIRRMKEINQINCAFSRKFKKLI